MQRRRVLAALGLAGGAVVGGVAGVTRWRGNRYYTGPVSDHFDGERFFNPGGAPLPGTLDLLRWQFGERRAAWPEHYPAPPLDRPPVRVDGGGLRVSCIGHASFLIQTGGVNLVVDPVWAERASPVGFAGPRRVNAPGIAFESLPPIDVVLVTHNHYDHLDVSTLARLTATHRPRVVAPLGNDVIIRGAVPDVQVDARDWFEHVDVAAGVRVHLAPTQHWSARSMFDRRHALWTSFVIESPAGKVYAVGDSGLGTGRTFTQVRERHGTIRLALLPIGAYEPRWFMREQHMNPDDAVQALQLCGAQEALGHHWGTFQLTNEPIEAPPRHLADALAHHGVDPRRFRPARPGDVWTSA
jgi:L-ascorbate metabolism protein UlaG (beta-lactamase superfamily)